MGKKITVDTNCLIDNPELLLDGNNYAISYTVLQELDKHKTNPELSLPARNAIKIINQEYEEGRLEIINVPTSSATNDEKIVEDTKAIGGTLMSQDIGALVVAKARGVDTVPLNKVDDYDRDFKGYKEYNVDEKFYYSLTQNEYMVPEIDEYIEDTPPLNSYVVLYPEVEGKNYIVFRKFEDRYILIPQGTKHTLRKAGIGIDWLHPEQLIAFDCVFNEESKLAVVTGKIGSSKTLMSMCGALSRVCGTHSNKKYDKILVTRPNIPINRSYALGFMPGTLEEKMSGWLAPIKTNLQFLYETTQKDRENEEADKIYSEFFEAMPIESIQGASYHSKILLVDEAQLLDTNTLRQVMSRVAEGSKLVLILDPSQTYGANRGMEGYKKLLPACKGNKHISFVELQHIQRSELTKVVDEIFK
jgi:predicted ribonuclease YlaK